MSSLSRATSAAARPAFSIKAGGSGQGSRELLDFPDLGSGINGGGCIVTEHAYRSAYQTSYRAAGSLSSRVKSHFQLIDFISPDASTSWWQCAFSFPPGKIGERTQNCRSASFPYLCRILVFLRGRARSAAKRNRHSRKASQVAPEEVSWTRGCRAAHRPECLRRRVAAGRAPSRYHIPMVNQSD